MMEDKNTTTETLPKEPAPAPVRSDMKVRVLSGAVYILILFAFFAMKLFVWCNYTDKSGEMHALHIGTLLFDMLILAFAAIGTFEMLRAFRGKLLRSQCVVVYFFSLLMLLSYMISDWVFAEILGIGLPTPGLGGISEVMGRNYSMYFALSTLIAGVIVLFSFLVFAYDKVTLESAGYSLVCYLYPSMFLLLLSICNHFLVYSELAVLLVFIVCPFADTFAYLFGRAFGKRYPKKMAPSISPKKTVVGGVGGLLGGALGAIVIFFACYGLTFLDDIGVIAPLRWELAIDAPNILFFIAVGVITAAFSQFGDLVESAVKRKLGLKDMGKIMPGHGGILDRIDSALYAGPVVALLLVARIMIVG